MSQIPVVNIRERAILTIFGLPQDFLTSVGLDPESFDQLPE